MILRPLLIVLAILLVVPNFIDRDINEQFAYNNLERFHPGLASINNIDKLEQYVDKTADDQHIDRSSAEYNLLLSYIVSCRFYHGFSHYKLNQNWIAAVAERVTGIGLSCKVDPDDIMKHPYAACSQQALVMMEILKRKKTEYRKVGFPHHYALEVKNKDNWYYFDSNMEPYMNLSQRLHQNWNESNDNLKKYYDSTKHAHLEYQFGNGQKATFGPINEVPAKNLNLFQSITSVLSKICWIFPLVILFAKSRSRKMRAVKPVNRSVAPLNLQPSFSA